MINVMIDELDVLDLLSDRVRFWTDDTDVIGLFEVYYEDMVDCGAFEGAVLDIKAIVDNDYVNWFAWGTLEELKESFDSFTEEDIYAEYNGIYLYRI